MSVKLDDRLKLIASYVRKGDSVCDVGTDHGFIPIYLKEEGISDKVIMSDVSKGSLGKAKADAEMELGLLHGIDARLGDGLDVLEPGECDDVIIAGMGGLLIIDILSWDVTVTSSFRRFILQPRNNVGKLREWLDLAGFSVTDQVVVMENGHYCEILCCDVTGSLTDPGLTYRSVYDKDPVKMALYDYPDGLNDPLGRGTDKKYFESELAKARRIKASILEHAADAPASRIRELDVRIERLEELCLRVNS